MDRTLTLWNLKTGQALKTIATLTGSVTAMAITPDGRRVLAGTPQGLIKQWDIETGGEGKSLLCLEGGVLALAITPDGTRAVSGSSGFAVNVWDIETGATSVT